jgi:hypothetical protein
MKRFFLLASILVSLGHLSNAQDIIGTKYSYSNVGNDYSIYLHSSFSLGSGGICPSVKWVQAKVLNDTVFVNAIYDLTGHWPTSFCEHFDTAKYTNTVSGINYFKVSTNYVIENKSDASKIDTFWSVHDTTFNLHTSGIPESKTLNTLSIYPNPTGQFIHLPKIVGGSEIDIYDALGQKALQIKNLSSQTIEVGSLSRGLHFVVLYDKDRNKIGIGKFYKE